jgi:hypothetical protein
MANDLDEQKRQLELKLKMHAASMGGNIRLPRKSKKTSTPSEPWQPKGPLKEIERAPEKREPTETAYELTQKALEMADKVAATKGVQNMITNPIMSSTTKTRNDVTMNPRNTMDSMQQNNNVGKKRQSSVKKAVSTKDPDFSSTPPNQVRPLKVNDTLADILAKMYNLMVFKYEYDNKKHKADKKYRKVLQDLREKHIEELIGLFGGRYKRVKVKKEKQEEETAKREGSSFFSGILTTLKKGVDKALSIFNKPTVKAAKEAVKESAKPGVSTATKVIVGTTAVTALSSMAKIASAESKGDPNQMNITSKEVKNGNQSTAMVVPGNVDITTGKQYDKKLTDMTIPEVIELGRRRNAQLDGGGAAGKYQFEPNTLYDEGRKDGLAPQTFGPNWRNERFSLENQEKLMEFLTAQNIARLEKAGVPVSDQSLYAMHFTGNMEKTKKIINGPESTSMADVLGKAGARQNPSVAKLTVGQYKSSLEKKGFSSKPIKSPMISPVPPVNIPPDPKQLNNQSTSKSDSISMLNNTTNIAHGGTTYLTEEERANRPALIEKTYYG